MLRLSITAAQALVDLKERRTAAATDAADDQRRFSNHLTGEQAARILDAAPITRGLLAAVPNPGARATQYYMVAVRSLSNPSEQCQHPHPIKRLKGWFRHFLHTPLFQRFNLVNEPGFPNVEPPGGSQAWSTARFSKNGADYLVVATCALYKKRPPTAAARDTVVFHLYSPALPSNHPSLTAIGAHSSHARRSVGTHMALGAMALAQGMEPIPDANGPSTTHFDTGFEHGDALGVAGTFERLHYRGAFHSYEAETASGSAIIPLLMRHCFFLGPALWPQLPVHYDIVQPHRYAYLFRVRFLSGWELFGAVNLHVEDNLLRPAFVHEGAPVVDRNPPLMVANPERWASRLGPLRQLDTLLKQAFTQSLNAYIAAMATHAADPAVAPFMKNGAPSIEKQTSDAQKGALPTDVWRALITTTRIERMQAALKEHLQSVEDRTLTALGDRLLLLHNSPPLTDDELLTVLYEALHGLAALLLPDGLSNTNLLQEANHPVDAQTTLSLDLLAPRAHTRDLIGKPPRQWAQCALASDDPARLNSTLAYICQNPDAYAALLLLDTPRLAELKPPFFANAWLRHSDFASARADAQWCVKATPKRPNPRNAANAEKCLAKRRNGLVYYLFSRDATLQYSNWQ
jgi:hypothetical protein